MKTSNIVAAAALSLLAAVGAHAETYEGVIAPVSAASRAQVEAEAAAVAATSANPYADGMSSRVAQPMASSADRATIRAQAEATAHEANQNLDRKAFVNSVVPSQYKTARPVSKQAGL